MIIVMSPKNEISETELETLKNYFSGDVLAILSPSSQNNKFGMKVSFFDSESELDVSSFRKLISGQNITHVIVRNGEAQNFILSFGNSIFTNSLPKFLELFGEHLTAYNFSKNFCSGKSGRVLFVYPGELVPAINGSRQRALSLILELLFSGYSVTVADLRGHSEHDYREFLEQFSIELRTLGARRMPATAKARQKAIRAILRQNGLREFSARTWVANGASFSKYLRENIANFDVVLFSHTWTVPRKISFGQACKVIIDTHDLNYVRDKPFYEKKGLVGKILWKTNKKNEIKRLKSANLILTVSDSDLENLKMLDNMPRVETLLPNFNWINASRPKKQTGKLVFGFIGTDMVANRKSVDYIREILWPSILTVAPTATLIIAGKICKYSESKYGNGAGIIHLGIVTDLQEFYDEIDASLCPVFIQGGLNFKVVESIVAAKPVLVSQMGEYVKELSDLVYLAEDDLPNTAVAKMFLKHIEYWMGEQSKALEEGARVKIFLNRQFENQVKLFSN